MSLFILFFLNEHVLTINSADHLVQKPIFVSILFVGCYTMRTDTSSDFPEDTLYMNTIDTLISPFERRQLINPRS